MEVQQFGSLSKVTAGLFNSSNDQLALHAVDGVMIAEIAARTGWFLPLDKSFRQIFGPDVLRRAQDDSALYSILQFANVSRPVVLFE